jgi:hypothetical protein
MPWAINCRTWRSIAYPNERIIGAAAAPTGVPVLPLGHRHLRRCAGYFGIGYQRNPGQAGTS